MEKQYCIDGVDLDYEQLLVHEKNLLELIKEHSYVEAVYYLLTGKIADSIVVNKFNKLLIKLLKFGSLKNNLFNNLRTCSTAYELKLISALSLVPDDKIDTYLEEVAELFPNVKNALELLSGLYLFAVVPVIIAFLQSNRAYNFVKSKVDQIRNYVDIALLAFSQNEHSNPKIKLLFDKLLIAFYAGFGIITPTIVLTRFSASTYAPMRLNLIAGLTGSGPAHVGACKETMFFLENIKSKSQHEIRQEISITIKNGKKISGFGHPLFYRDPRNEPLELLTTHCLSSNSYMKLYQQVSEIMFSEYNLRPNIDAIAAVILLELDIEKELGSVLFLYARMPSMIAHALEKKSRPAFGFKRSEARERFKRFPVDWI